MEKGSPGQRGSWTTHISFLGIRCSVEDDQDPRSVPGSSEMNGDEVGRADLVILPVYKA